MLMTTERRPAGNARLRIFYPIYRRKKNGSKAAWRTMLAAAPVQSTHLWTHDVLVTVTASFRRVFETRRGRKMRCPAPPIRIR